MNKYSLIDKPNKKVEDTFVEDDSCDVNGDMKYDENFWAKRRSFWVQI